MTESQARRLRESIRDLGAEVREVVAQIRALGVQADTLTDAALRLAADVNEVTGTDVS